jgi:hypothetical protein
MYSRVQRATPTLLRPRLKSNRLLLLKWEGIQVVFGLYIMLIPLMALDMGLALLQPMVSRGFSPLSRRFHMALYVCP